MNTEKKFGFNEKRMQLFVSELHTDRFGRVGGSIQYFDVNDQYDLAKYNEQIKNLF